MIKNILESVINEILDEKDKLTLTRSNRLDLCDYQSNDIFKLAKMHGKNPIQIGQEIVSKIKNMPNFNEYFNSVEFAPPGFINIIVSDFIINKSLEAMLDKDKFGIKPENKKTYFLDYGGPNVAKPLHVGHLRSAIVGESIKRIIKYMGHDVISDVHLGDYGLQIGEVIYGILEEKPNKIDLDFLDYIYPKMNDLCKENKEIKEKCALITKELQEGNEEYINLWKEILLISKNDIKRQYKYLDVSFDIFEGESDAYAFIPKLTEIVQNKNLLIESENAKVISITKTTDINELPPLIYQKSNGAYLYGTTDLATILKRVETYNINHMIYIADLRQALHFEQVFRAATLAELKKDMTYSFCGFGTVNGKDGKPFKTRKGDAPKLDSMFKEISEIFINTKENNKNMSQKDIDIIVNAIIKFADLQNNRERDYVFDIEKFSEVVGKTGPYILYSYLRNQKILNDNKYEKIIGNNIYNKFERDLKLKITELELSLTYALKDKLPNYIAEYIYELCTFSNIFYQNNHINNLEDEIKKSSWLTLLYLTNNVLKEMLSLLIIEIPSQM